MDAPRVLLTTEGTYPFVVGGVSSWCDLLVRGATEVHWQLMPLVAAGETESPAFQVPEHAQVVEAIELWNPADRPPPVGGAPLNEALPAELARALLRWDADPGEAVWPLVWARLHPGGVRPAFRSRAAWEQFAVALDEIVSERSHEATPSPLQTAIDAARLYQTLYWVARVAASPTPETDLIMVTAAGWAAIPALVHRALHGTPVLLVEHGVYVREAYLAAARAPDPAAARWGATRLARGLARAAYGCADVVACVSEANARWERGLGVDPDSIRVVHNGVGIPETAPKPAPRTRTIVSVGRIDPLKDVHTMLRVADRVTQALPDATVLQYGPVTPGQEVYGRSVVMHHERLGLGDRFRFMGSTRDPHGVMADADLVLLTSISEGLPLALLEAMAQARPVVATAVGGVPDVVRGCGLVAAPGDADALARACVTLLRDPDLAERLGRRGLNRVRRRFRLDDCIAGFRSLIGELTAEVAA